MDRLRHLISMNPHLLGDQPIMVTLIGQLNDAQADKLANMLLAYMRTLGTGEIREAPSPTVH